MKKGKIGLSLPAIAVIAFVFAAMNQVVAVLLVTGFALLAEKDEWLNCQVTQAMLLSIVYNLIVLVFNVLFDAIITFFGWLDAYQAVSVFGEMLQIIRDLLFIALIVFCVLSVIKNLKGKDANLPLLSKLAEGDFAKAFGEKKTSQTHVCPNCGAEVNNESKFCPQCGNSDQ